MRWIGWLSTGGAAALVVAAVLVAISSIMPGSGLAQRVANVLPMAEPHATAAQKSLSREDFGAAIAESQAELAVSPIREAAWLRLAKIDLAQHRKLTADGLAALDHAYDATPYDLDPKSERIAFVLDNFDALPPSLLPSVLDELGAWSSSPILRPVLLSAADHTQSQAAREAVRRLTGA